MAEFPASSPSPAFPLHVAAHTGDTETLARLLSEGVNPNQADSDGRTALIWAAQSGREDAARFLLKAGASVNQPGPRNITALVYAVREGYAGIIRLLLSRGAETAIYSAPQPHTPPSAEEVAKRRRMTDLYRQGEKDQEPEERPRGPLGATTFDALTWEEIEKRVEDAAKKAKPRRVRLVFSAIKSGNPDALQALLAAGLDPDENFPPYPGTDDGTDAVDTRVSPLSFAVTFGDARMLQLLLEYGANVNGNEGTPPLVSAVMRGTLPLIRLLLEAGADPNRGTDAMSPLVFATFSQRPDIVSLLMEYGASVQKEAGQYVEALSGDDQKVQNALALGRKAAWHEAVRSGDTDAVRAALDTGATVETQGSDDNTALMIAAQAGHLGTLLLLVERGATVNARNRFGDTPLHYAAKNEKESSATIITSLVERGASVDALNEWGMTPLFLALVRSNTPAVNALRCAGAAVGIVEAALLGEEKTVWEFVSAGVPVDARSSTGMTALMGAAASGHVPLLRWLLEQGADIEARNKAEGHSALDWAVQRQHLESVRILLAAGADINARGKTGTPLASAATKRDADMVRLLLVEGASVRADDDAPFFAGGLVHRTLWAEAEYSKVLEPQILPILLEAGADANARNGEAQTPLQVVVEKNLPQAYADLFLAHGADVNTRIRGKTWLLQAVEADDEALVRRLLDWKADVNRGDHWFNPLDIAVARGNESIAALLREHGSVTSPRLAEANVTDKEKDDLLRSYIWNVKRPDTATEEARVGVIEVTKDPIPVIKMKRKWDDRRDASAATAEEKD